MSEPVWYYARGDAEKGPVTIAQIKALAASGKIRRDDFVWKEGMENWIPAREIPELFGNGRSAEPAPATRQTSRPWTRLRQPAPQDTPLVPANRAAGFVQPFGRTFVVVGLCVVLFARGCDRVGDRHVERLRALAENTEQGFHDDWQRRRTALQLEQEAVASQVSSTPSQQKRLREIANELDQLEQQRREARPVVQAHWEKEYMAARNAARENARWGFWREAAFTVGTLVLAVGLLSVAFYHEGPERWICLAILGAILAGVYWRGPQ